MHLSDQFRTMLLLLTKKKTNHRTPPGVLQDTVFDFLIGRKDILSVVPLPGPGSLPETTSMDSSSILWRASLSSPMLHHQTVALERSSTARSVRGSNVNTEASYNCTVAVSVYLLNNEQFNCCACSLLLLFV